MPAQGRYFKQPDKQLKTGSGILTMYTPIDDEKVPALKRAALDFLRRGHPVGELPDLLGVTASFIHWWRIEDPAYGAEFEQAIFDGRRQQESDWMELFLEVYTETFNVARACKHVGIGLAQFGRARRDNPEFRQAFAEAKAACLDAVEGALYDKALSGGKGSETAAIMLLNAHRPKRYKGKGGSTSGDVTFTFIVGPQVDEPKKLPAQTGPEIVLDD